jgi:hypothetical protein
LKWSKESPAEIPAFLPFGIKCAHSPV